MSKESDALTDEIISADVNVAPRYFTKARFSVLIPVWLLVFFGINVFYKTKLVLRTDYDWTIVFDFFGADGMLGLAIATTLIISHELSTAVLHKIVGSLSNPFSPRVLAIIQYCFSVLVGILGVFGTLQLWFRGLYGMEPDTGFMIDMAVIATGLPLIIIGVLDSFHYHGAWQKERLQHEESARHALAAELEALRTHINPHFLFNSFATLSQFIKDDAESAVEFVDDLSDVYRYVLQNREEETVVLADELKAVEALVRVQKARVPGGLVLDMAIDERARRARIPTLAIYTLMENALKHNIVAPQQPLTVRINIDDDGHLVVENNLQPRRTRASLGSGLDNLDRRFRLMSDKGLEIIKNDKFFTVKTPLLGYSS
ncbi:sensor histidine kinase [Kordiimonas aquimaris]|uniref:sensor histidine kinase n=1 Tax=Kordiimonas aquimaris TaxID=707591 RepID=UPI0021D24AEB|nr:histidine kinase [Kordiimonas aquimaris]